ncbi:CsgE family curli-type amyloid fiber assembly protein [Microbulbifer sp. 2205BS26-8]|uniref:CsgE family curli-type amyloid fiber assembly protein n=1 Tax=Microbulbifer sp. 2205BS26-8 TaxID=3064386 RepID=UPI00273F6128|nr:CsgE family curli-type amyloid fiber assembly protein [Microbulbifer sp. 2205BS26-8]MDP5209211.1 CsgE family curli-type amyloid fiber assembly protein [Microbulbifer sp. 2205BS26-8]
MRLITLILALSTSFTFWLEDTNALLADTDSGILEDAIHGFYIDRTVTQTGQDFVRYISEYRKLNYPDATYMLTIYERPSSLWGNLIWVTYNGRIIFRRFIIPSTSGIYPLAIEAAQYIHETILQERIRSPLIHKTLIPVHKDTFIPILEENHRLLHS